MEVSQRPATAANGVHTDPSTLTDAERRERTASVALLAAQALWRRRFFLVVVGLVAAVAGVAFSYTLPVYYQSEARLLMPESGGAMGGTITTMVNKLAPGAAALLGGGGGGDFTRYLAILNSRSTLEEVAERFDLATVYETDGGLYARSKTLDALAKNVDFGVDLEHQFLAIRVMDLDPRRAADMANFFVEVLNNRSEALSVDQARRYREYVEDRYDQSIADIDSAQSAMQRFQERHGVIELPEMAKVFLETAASQRAEGARAEIQYRAALAQYGPDNAQVQQLAQVVRAIRSAETSMMTGQDRLMPVAFADLPALANEYARLYRDMVMYGSILEITRPLLEQARFDEERDRTAVQVLDEAIAPERKAKPRRSLVAAGILLTALLLACVYVLLQAWIRARRPAVDAALAVIRADG